MEAIKKALLATHDDGLFIRAMRRQLRGYEFTDVRTVDEALRLCAENRYDVYVVEANLGEPYTANITGFRRIYEALVSQGVEGLEQRMVAFSSTQGALDAVAQLGIPTVEKTRLGGYLHSHFVNNPPQ